MRSDKSRENPKLLLNHEQMRGEKDLLKEQTVQNEPEKKKNKKRKMIRVRTRRRLKLSQIPSAVFRNPSFLIRTQFKVSFELTKLKKKKKQKKP